MILLDRNDPALEAAVPPEHFALFCTPAINLFPRKADRIHLNERENEYHVVPDRTRPMDFEVHSVSEVIGYGSSASTQREFLPFYACTERTAHDEAAGLLHGAPRSRAWLRPRQRGGRARPMPAASCFCRWSMATRARTDHDLRQLAIDALCTNRDLPLQMTRGRGPHRLHARIGRAGRGRALRRGPLGAAAVARLVTSLAAHQPPVAELPVADRRAERAGRRGPARAAAALRRPGSATSRRADRGRALGPERADHAAVAGARARRLRPRPRDHARLRRGARSRAPACSCSARCSSAFSPNTFRSTRSPRPC